MSVLQVVGLGFDPVTKKVFWSTRGKILAAPLTENALPGTILERGKALKIIRR